MLWSHNYRQPILDQHSRTYVVKFFLKISTLPSLEKVVDGSNNDNLIKVVIDALM
jgi:hypothetical protein